jgi:DUF4097 and DUF4098 domain-containing protein YvlB
MLHTLLMISLLSVAAPEGQRPPPPAPPAAPQPPEPPKHGDRERDRNRDRDDRGRWVASEPERIVNTYKVGDGGSLRLANIAGDVTITGAGGGEITIEAVKRGRGRTDAEAMQRRSDVQVDMRQNGNRVEVDTIHRRGSRAWVDYTVSVPVGTALDIKSVAGDVKLTNVKGEVRAESVSGTVVASSLFRVAALKSVSGDVKVTNCSSDSEAALGSVSGSVVAEGFKARSVDVTTVSGDVFLKGCTCGQARANSVSGTITYTGKLEKQGRYEFKTHSGDIKIASSDGYEIDASTFSGSVKPEGLVMRMGDSSEGRMGRSVKSTVGGGGAGVEARTFSGSIYLMKQ